MHFFVSVVVAIGCGLSPWAAQRAPTRWAVIVALALLVVIVAGAVFGLAFYPYSDVVVAAFSVIAGIALGRAMPPRFRPLLVLLVVLSALDVAQNLLAAGPSTGGPVATTQPDPHFIWFNFRLPLAGGHFNIGFADLGLIAAVSENLRRRGAPLPLTLLPGVIGLGLGEALTATLSQPAPTIVTAISESLIPFLTGGFVLTELAVGQRQES